MAVTEGPASPVRSQAFSAVVQGRPTEFCVSFYVDRVMIVITQLKTFGVIMQCTREQVLGGGSTFRVDTLLGSRQAELPQLCARQLGQLASDAGIQLPLLVSLGLEPDAATPAAVREILQALSDRKILQGN